MEIIYKGKNKWLYRDPYGKYIDLSVEVNEAQRGVFQVHCQFNAFKETRLNKEVDFIELAVRPLPTGSAHLCDSRPDTRRIDKKTPLVWNSSTPEHASWVFYDYKRHDRLQHDCYMTFKESEQRRRWPSLARAQRRPQRIEYELEGDEKENLMLFEITLGICFQRSMKEKILGDHNYFLYEPVHASAVVFN